MRNIRIDILRFIGLAMIIFAHTGPSKIWFQLRNFDVPLMVLVSGMSFSLSYKANIPYTSYIWKRVKRLVFPVWIFLAGYFFVYFTLLQNPQNLTQKSILHAYIFVGGIGYVWIFRVFLLVSLVAPFLFLLNKKIESNRQFCLFLSILFIGYEVFRYVSLSFMQDGIYRIAGLIIYYGAAYSLIFLLGLRMISFNRRQTILVSFACLVVFFLIGISFMFEHGEFVWTQKLKNPPSFYYFSYAIFVSSILWFFSSDLEKIVTRLKLKSPILFVAQNSLWIYLWHIPLISLVQKGWSKHFFVEYIPLFICSCLIAYCQFLVVNRILLSCNLDAKTKKTIKALFTG